MPVGTTSRGTRLEVFEPYLEADLRICTGNIEYHYFAGFSGGAKAVVPGLCSYAAIRDNHSMMLAPTARAGIIAGNPVREDIDEAGGIIGVDFIFNVLLDEEKRIIRAVAGHYLEAHRAGAAAYDARCDLRIPEAADVVVASPGGTPKDINLYQAQKTLDNVGGAVRDGGVIVLVGALPRGLRQQGVRGVDDRHGHAAGAHRPHPAGVRARRPQGGRRRGAAARGRTSTSSRSSRTTWCAACA